PEVIHYTLDTLGAFIGPLYGVLIADYYLVKKQKVDVDALYTLQPTGAYHYRRGYNLVAVVATAAGAVLAMLVVFLGSSDAAASSWFIGAGVAFALHWSLSRRRAASGDPVDTATV
ncbi:MAG: cytosine permease, partial [Pseudonocardia sp.]